eukprot:TRINITY_DN11452_c0_g1_i1.p1 TRINITY_DN11452_c0_g1~~TRINITY_DN11452_c0_g1_i1.p1  ORF type:complete len:746 (+),score=152.08 TRINITY_DN11452_c0_g1_i1:185-2422(+)
MSSPTDAELEKQAKDLAEKSLPTTLPEAVRTAKLPAVAAKILERLKKQREEKQGGQAAAAAAPAGAAAAVGNAVAGAPPPPTGPPPPAPPPPPDVTVVRIDGVEMCGDELWFADDSIRTRLRVSVVEAHREQKILVGPPADEVTRICPTNGRVLGAGAVLRLGGAHQGGYGEPDVAYAYRQLARALHPDKNPNLPNAAAAFKRLSEAADELRKGLTEQREVLTVLAAVTGSQVTPELQERPQEALFAEACRVLYAVCTAVGEGHVPSQALARATAYFVQVPAFQTCQPQVLINDWFHGGQLLDLYGGAPIRTAYDCAPKRCRAQFLCLLSRALSAEATRCGDDCVRGSWAAIMQNFPELGLWRDFRERLHQHVWDSSGDPEGAAAALGEEAPEIEEVAPKAPEMEPRTKALKLLESTWQACSGPDFQSAYEQLRRRGKMSLQLGIGQLMDQATKEAATRLGIGEWTFQQTVTLVQDFGDDEQIRKKALEVEKMVSQPRLFKLKSKEASRSRSRRRSRSRSRSRRRRRRRSRTRSRRRSRSRSGGRRERRKDEDKKKEDSSTTATKKGTKDGSAQAIEDEKKKLVPGRTADGLPVYRAKWDGEDEKGERRRCARWARRWRMALGAVVPSGLDSALPIMHRDLRHLAAALWLEVKAWAEGTELERCLALFQADKQTPQTFGWDGQAKAPRGLEPDFPPGDWAFLPMTDLFTVVGDGIVGVTAEGVFGNTVKGHQRFTLEEFDSKIPK